MTETQTTEPLAWAVRQDGRLWLAIYPSKSAAKSAAMQLSPPGSKQEIFPIYEQPAAEPESQAPVLPFHNANEEMTPDELNRMIAETIWMADRPRTWREWWSWQWQSLWSAK